MSTGEQIRDELKALVIDHPSFVNVISRLQSRIDASFKGHPCLELVTGPSRSGKTEVLKSILSRYPITECDGRREIPVLYVYIPHDISPKGLPLAVLAAIKVPLPTGATSVRRLEQMMINQLTLAKVRIILFDEASHLVEPGARIQRRAAADWFKDLYANVNEIGLILTGLPRLNRLLDNEQLRNRARSPTSLMPYRWDDNTQRTAFAGCVKAYLNVFAENGCDLDQNMNDFIRNCYAVSAGFIGLLARFFLVLAEQIVKPAPLTISMCFEASLTINLSGYTIKHPFHEQEFGDVDLMQVHASELDRSGMALKATSAVAELAKAKVAAASRSLD